MKLLCFLTIGAMLLSSCETTDPQAAYTSFSNSISLSLIGPDGQDLLDPDQESFDREQVVLYYVVDGVKQEIYDANQDLPRMYMFYEDPDSGINYTRIFLNMAKGEEFPVTLMQWTENDLDTLKADYRRTSNSVSVQSVWLNDQLIWNEQDTNTSRQIEVSKSF